MEWRRGRGNWSGGGGGKWSGGGRRAGSTWSERVPVSER